MPVSSKTISLILIILPETKQKNPVDLLDLFSNPKNDCPFYQKVSPLAKQAKYYVVLKG